MMVMLPLGNKCDPHIHTTLHRFPNSADRWHADGSDGRASRFPAFLSLQGHDAECATQSVHLICREFFSKGPHQLPQADHHSGAGLLECICPAARDAHTENLTAPAWIESVGLDARLSSHVTDLVIHGVRGLSHPARVAKVGVRILYIPATWQSKPLGELILERRSVSSVWRHSAQTPARVLAIQLDKFARMLFDQSQNRHRGTVLGPLLVFVELAPAT